MRIVEVEVVSSELFGEGGFVRLRRLLVRNRREDGSCSPLYLLDAVERPAGADAVVVIAHERTAGGERVLLREGLRPVPRLGRGGEPSRDGGLPPIQITEAVAGILEETDQGEEGLRRRAALELHEEVGLEVEAGRIEPMGPPVFLSAGIMAELIYFCRVEIGLGGHGPGPGDGSALEEGGGGVVLGLEEALQRCASGAIEDAKTELALRRLADHLRSRTRIDDGASP